MVMSSRESLLHCMTRRRSMTRASGFLLLLVLLSPRSKYGMVILDAASRREALSIIGSTALIWTSSLNSASCAAAIGTEDLTGACRGDALAPESAIPGAYQQVCMSLATRDIPVSVPGKGVVPLKIEQGMVGAGSTGLAVWNSSLLLKRLLERITAGEPSWLQGKTLLELGCGTGVDSLAAALLGADKIIATDGNPQVLELARANVVRNSLDAKVMISKLQWGLMDAIDLADVADIVIGADLTYGPGNWRSLAETMATVLSKNGVVIYLSLGHTGFNVNAEMDGFLAVAKETGLTPIQPFDPEWPFESKISLESRLRESIAREERTVLDSTGGVRILVLGNKSRLRATKM